MSGKRGGAELLVELGTEELPPAALRPLGEAFAKLLAEALTDAGLADQPETTGFASPRRLAVRVGQVARKGADQTRERRGPALAAAYDDSGQATAAAAGFARSCGVEVSELTTLSTDRGEWLAHRAVIPGAPAKALIGSCIQQALDKLPVPKRMRWGNGTEEFVRPVHWLVVLHGRQVVPCTVFGIASGRMSRGHRFMGQQAVHIASASDYEHTLKDEGAVIADFAERAAMIAQQVTRLGKKAGGRAVIDRALLETVAALVEKPHALLGRFDPAFLKVPQEALVSSMRDHQKYFHVVDAKGALLPAFITVSNIRSSTPARVRAGNERVLNARLADAKFFWETDAGQPLATRADELKNVLFHHALGSLADKTQRVETLSSRIAQAVAA
ncbi:MAG TPA: glycine--tRNA ligase subunit beta, partial [Gammaproteobacteria bacterium]|nr:glycine--tRNA ligase subunit beta [Gammaproteobacteria bacterium]